MAAKYRGLDLFENMFLWFLFENNCIWLAYGLAMPPVPKQALEISLQLPFGPNENCLFKGPKIPAFIFLDLGQTWAKMALRSNSGFDKWEESTHLWDVARPSWQLRGCWTCPKGKWDLLSLS